MFSPIRVLIIVGLGYLLMSDGANPYLCMFVMCREVVADSIRSLAVQKARPLSHNAFGRLKMCAVVLATVSALVGPIAFISAANLRVATDACLFIAAAAGIVSVLLMFRTSSHMSQSESQPTIMTNVQ